MKKHFTHYIIYGSFAVLFPFLIATGCGTRLEDAAEQSISEEKEAQVTSPSMQTATRVSPATKQEQPSQEQAQVAPSTSAVQAPQKQVTEDTTQMKVPQTDSASGESYEAILKEISHMINGQCPMKVDEQTQLKSTSVGPGKRFTFIYTQSGPRPSDGSIQKLRTQMKPLLIKEAQTRENYDPFRQNGIELVYIYKDIKGAEIFTITLSPEEYIR